MKKLVFALLSTLLLLFGSCKDPCDDLNCNAGNCVEGICNCDEGYEGTNCESEVREKYYGTWTGPNMCDNELIALESITLIITESDEGLNFLTMETSVEGAIEVPLPPENAELFGNAFETGPTTVDIGSGVVTFSSDGIFKSDTEMTLDFVVSATDPFPITINCTADLTKQ